MSAKLKAPQNSGEHLAVPDFPQAFRQLQTNRENLDSLAILIDGIPLPDLRKLARTEAGVPAFEPLIVTGHQPEFNHPGVWVKNFAACGLARRAGGTALNLIVDTDTVKSTAIRLPTWPENKPIDVSLLSLAYDDVTGEVPFELRDMVNPGLFASFGQRLTDAVSTWPFEPIGARAWQSTTSPRLTESIARLRQTVERAWGCDTIDLTVSRLARFQSFQRFVRHIAADHAHFRECYNTSLAAYRKAHRVRSRNHPAPDLAEGELPFWRMSPTRRERAFGISELEQLRPRALTLTLFSRLVLGDYFIHGLGGGLYDQVTDEIIRRFFGFEPPAYQILTATLHLPFPQLPEHYVSKHFHDVNLTKRSERDLHWNPHRFLDEATQIEHRRIAQLPESTHAERVRRFELFRDLAARNRERVTDNWSAITRKRVEYNQHRETNAIFTRRDYAWILYPESVLKPFLQRFLDI